MVFGYFRWTDHFSHFLHHSYLRKMTLLHLIFSILGTICWATEVVITKQVPPVDIYWNRTNNIFLRNNNDHIVQVQIGERVTFQCPSYEETDRQTDTAGEWEHYIIYKVPKLYFDSCYIPNNANESQLQSQYGIVKIHNCSSPHNSPSYTIHLLGFGALPGSFGGLQYQSGKEYYFTSLSTGTLNGLHNRLSARSACKNYNMKAIVRVCCNDTFTEPPIVTGDPPPITEMIKRTSPTTTLSADTPTTTVTWSNLTSLVSKKYPKSKTVNFTVATNPHSVNSAYRLYTCVYTLLVSFILGTIARELT